MLFGRPISVPPLDLLAHMWARHMSGAARALYLYRRLLRFAGRLPAEERPAAVSRIRAAFRAGAVETSPEAVRTLLADANSSLGYLRIVTPRRPGDDVDNESTSAGSNSRRYIVSSSGELVPAPGENGARPPVAGAPVLAATDLRRHAENMKRFHFSGSSRAR